MTKHPPSNSRPPRGHQGFSWGRFAHTHGVEYRLFRRDLSGRLYSETRRFYHDQSRSEIAVRVWEARKFLRDRVDAIVLMQLGVMA